MTRAGFLAAEGGAVSTDWMALTGALMGMALMLVASLSEGTESLGDTTATAMGQSQVTVLGTLGWSE
jgi:hypothetical protein